MNGIFENVMQNNQEWCTDHLLEIIYDILHMASEVKKKVGFGFIHKKTKSYITVNAYGMNAFAKGVFQNGQIFQTSSGDSLSV